MVIIHPLNLLYFFDNANNAKDRLIPTKKFSSHKKSVKMSLKAVNLRIQPFMYQIYIFFNFHKDSRQKLTLKQMPTEQEKSKQKKTQINNHVFEK